MKSKPYNTFWQHIHQTARAKAFPLRVMFELTYRCNFRCRHCYVPKSYRKKGELRTKEIFSVLAQLKDIGCFYLGFTGGEPFIRKDILDILWFAKKKGFELIIYTNGSLINEIIVKELQKLRPNKVDITIPGISKAAFEAVSGVAGSRDKVFKAINLLYKSGVDLGFKTCVLKENKSEIKEIQNFAASLGSLHRLDDMLSPRLNGSKEPYKYRGGIRESGYQGVGYRDIRVSRNRVCEFNTKHRTPNPENLFRCGVGVSQAAITPLGELKMCLMIDYPRYKILTEARGHKSQVTSHKLNLKDAWDRLRELADSIKPDENYKCDICRLEAYCKWCPGRGWLYNRRFTSCDPAMREWVAGKFA